MSGGLSEVRLDVAALDLEPLALVASGRPDRCDGPSRVEYELEKVPCDTPVEPEVAVQRAIELWARDAPRAAEELLGGLLRRDLRCLAAHSCLGFLAFHSAPRRGGSGRARRHYEAGLEVAALSIHEGFDGVLSWSRAGNRPFLRCLYGRSVCLWREGDLAGAHAGFSRLCLLDPGDQLAARIALDRIERGG